MSLHRSPRGEFRLPELTNRRRGLGLAALLLLSASALTVAGCTSGTPVPPLGLALADVAASQPSSESAVQIATADDETSPSSEPTETVALEQGDGDGGEPAADTRLAMNDAVADSSPSAMPAASLAPPSSGSTTPPPPIALAENAATPQTAERSLSTSTAAASPVAPRPAGLPQPIRLPQNDIPRAHGQNGVALALAEQPRPIRLDRPVSTALPARPSAPAIPASATPAGAAEVVGAGNTVLPGVDKNRLFEIERKDGRSDNSDIDLDEADEPVQIASLSGLARLAPNGLKTQHGGVDVNCLKPALVRVLNQVERKFGRPVIVTSGFRSRQRNARARGAKRSLHMFCAAADIQVEGVSKWTLAEYLRGMDGRGGVGTYCHTKSVHIDVGPERDWNWRCKRRRRR